MPIWGILSGGGKLNRYERLPGDAALELSSAPWSGQDASDGEHDQGRPLSRRRLVQVALAVLGTIVSLLLAWSRRTAVSLSPARMTDTCPPMAFDAGSWERRVNPPNPPTSLATVEDIFAAMNVSTCAVKAETQWQLGLRKAEGPYDYRAPSLSYDYVLHPSCQLRRPTMLEKLQALVDGPLLLVGDSRCRQHYYQLSCELSEHVLWHGIMPWRDPDGNDRAWRLVRSHLVLDPASPLLPLLRLPSWFEANSTALVTYQVQYTPLAREEMRQLPGVNVSMIPDHVPEVGYPVYEYSMNYTLDLFANASSHYRTMLFSSNAHFAFEELIFPGADDPTLLAIFRAVLRTYYRGLVTRMRPEQRVLVRASGVGHSDCLNSTAPTAEVTLNSVNIWNWNLHPALNDVLEMETKMLDDERVVWLGGARMAALRPDAHLPGDCLHYAIGTGVFENWSAYMWHQMLETG